jgi:acyl carrier protein
VSAVYFIRPHTIPKTTSGKLQRFATRAALLAGSLAVDWSTETAAPSRDLQKHKSVTKAFFDESGASVEDILAAPAGSQEREQLVEKFVRHHLLNALAIPDSEQAKIDAHQSLWELGIDSVKSVEAKSALEDMLHIPLPATFLYEHTTLSEV